MIKFALILAPIILLSSLVVSANQVKEQLVPYKINFNLPVDIKIVSYIGDR